MRLHVLGNVTEDLLFRVPRLPAAGETLIAGRRDRDIGGKGLNQALVAARCGMAVCLVAPVGDDAAGADAARLLADEPLQARLIVKPGCPTDQSVIAVARDGENHIISSTQAADALTPGEAVAALECAQAGDALLVQGNLSAPTTRAAIDVARARRLSVIVNPSPIRWDHAPLLPLIDTLILNVHEAATLSGQSEPQAAAAYFAAAGTAEVVITLGAAGARHWRGGRSIAVPAARTRVVDTAGAGDTFCGTFVAACAQGLDVAAALHLAARAAAITVGRHGTWSAFPDRAGLARLFARQTGDATP